MDAHGPTIRVYNVHRTEPIFLENPILWPQKLSNRQVRSNNYLFISDFVKDKIHRSLDWGRVTPRNVVEQGGLLLGKVYCCGNEIYNCVEDILLADTQGSDVHVDFSPHVWEDFHRRLVEINSRRAPNDQLVVTGWFHTHPNNLSVFMSGTDLETQRLNFSQDWQVSLVMNPHQNRYRSFFGSNALEGNITFLDFQEIMRNQNNPQINLHPSPTITIRRNNSGNLSNTGGRTENLNHRIKTGSGKHHVKRRQPFNDFLCNMRNKVKDYSSNKEFMKSFKRAILLFGILTLGYLVVDNSIIDMLVPSILGNGYASDGHRYSANEIATIRNGLLSAISLTSLGVVSCLKYRLSIKKKLSKLHKEELVKKYEDELNLNKARIMRINSDLSLSAEEKKKRIEELLERQMMITAFLSEIQSNQENKRRTR